MTLVSQKKDAIDTGRELPESLRPFFWDVDFDRLDIQSNAFFIISRILEHGDEPSTRLLLRIYSEREIIQVVKTSRSLSRRSRNFWMIYFGVEDQSCSPR
jgi:hypothetical protein